MTFGERTANGRTIRVKRSVIARTSSTKSGWLTRLLKGGIGSMKKTSLKAKTCDRCGRRLVEPWVYSRHTHRRYCSDYTTCTLRSKRRK